MTVEGVRQLDAAVKARIAELEAAPQFQNRDGESFTVGDAVYVPRMDGTWLHAPVVSWAVGACDDDLYAVDPKCLRAHDYITVDTDSLERFTRERRTARADVVHVGSRPADTVLPQSGSFTSAWSQ